MLEVLRDLDDTRKYGSRVGSSWTGNQPQIYMEAFNDKEPEKREYFQVVEYRDGTCRYTASHESCFLRLEMGMDLYSAYYGVKQEPEYFLDSPDNAFTGDQVRYRFIFSSMKSYLDEYFLEKEGLVQPDPDMVEREKTETLTEKAVQLFHAEQYEESVHVLHEVLDLIGTEVSSDDLCVYICTCAKVAMTYCQMDQEEAEDEWWQKVLSMKERVLNEVKDGNQSALSCIVDAYVHFYRKLHRADDDGAYDSLAKALSLIEEHIPSFDKWPVLFEVYFSWAWHLEETDLDQCITYYRKAIAVARNHHLDQIPWCAQSVATTYFNFGWVLWNLAGSEEAIIPLGRALELMEDYDANHRISHETVLARMEHYGQELLTLYQQTSRTREAQDLVNHLREYGVDLEKQTE